MSRMTLLEMTQDILSDMDSDEVNSINDTIEATQVAQIIKTTYRAFISNRNWSMHRRLLELVPFSDPARPTHMSVPDNLKELIEINYNNNREGLEDRLIYERIRYLHPDEFLRYTNARNNSSAQTLVVTDPSGVKLLINNNEPPEYYTSFNDKDIVFDSYESDVDQTLQASKTQALGFIFPAPLELRDDAIPDIPLESFIGLLEEAKSRAQLKLNQIQDVKAEQEARRQQRWSSRKEWTVNGGIRFQNYGRRIRNRRTRRRYNEDPTFQDNY